MIYDPDLTPGVPSKYYVFSAWTDEGESILTSPSQQVTPLGKLVLVSPVNGATNVGTTPTFTWQPVANVDNGYEIYVYRKDQGVGTRLCGLTGIYLQGLLRLPTGMGVMKWLNPYIQVMNVFGLYGLMVMVMIHHHNPILGHFRP